MDKSIKKKILIGVACILAVLGVLCGIYLPNSNINNTISEVQNILETEIIEIDNQSTTEIPELTEEDEQVVEVQEVESEYFEEQGEIAYNGSDKAPYVEVGDYAGLTYYSQTDSRWGYKMYSNHNDSSQTIASSGCGPTSAAMVVSSIKGTVTPDVMADLYVNNGYRSYNNGTYLSAYKWTADVFDIEYFQTYDLDTAIDKLRNNHYIVVSCGNGLFTYEGHFIVLVGIEGDTLNIYDPYLYSGKFNTSTRRGRVSVNGNTVYCSIDNFRYYANATGFYCFKNDRTNVVENKTTVITTQSNSNVSSENYKVKVTANSGLNIRRGASTSYARVGGYAKNAIVTILAESNNWGKTDLGWICLDYTSRLENASSSNYSLGLYRVNARSGLNVRSGAGTNYSIRKVYQNGTRFDTYEIKGNWARTPSGWVCLDYCNLVRKY